jgi:hypothetical protein
LIQIATTTSEAQGLGRTLEADSGLQYTLICQVPGSRTYKGVVWFEML